MMSQQTFSVYLRQCLRCNEMYRAESKRSTICPNCYKPFGRRSKKDVDEDNSLASD